MEDAVKAMFSTLTDEIQKQVLTFPSVFANENISGYDHTDEDQLLELGYIRQIKIRRDKIKLYSQVLCLLPQQRFNEACFDLGIQSGYELHRAHWSIKKVDLIAQLRELGFQL